MTHSGSGKNLISIKYTWFNFLAKIIGLYFCIDIPSKTLTSEQNFICQNSCF